MNTKIDTTRKPKPLACTRVDAGFRAKPGPRGVRPKYRFTELEVGQSFFSEPAPNAPEGAVARLQNSLSVLSRIWGDKLGRTFSTHRDHEVVAGKTIHGVRVWRDA